MSDFVLSRLDDQDLGHLEFVLNSPSWERVFAPYLRGIRNGAIKRLTDPAHDRKSQTPDDFLRGVIATVDGMFTFFDKVIEETTVDRLAAARAESPEDIYTRHRLSGAIGPAGQVFPPADPEDPEEF